ncbi:Trihelix transcription factor GT-3b [Apostasia shenzhenica]|uniref:Trihelix transcription factor GT-3b n=1 Tax=Apostasia shenzhenica TaxID=1088818 RepID=A0A2I0AKV9_9ASPA|nr:Trihelix transcription factor GT-3b [Apostasia shenzhenica]
MEYHHHHHDSAGDEGGAGGERLPQWSLEETREFLVLRAELDQCFVRTKRNRALWATISSRMLLKGFSRSAEQCKSKWKNLLTRFKASEVMEGEASRVFPYYEEMKSIFSGRMERILISSEKGKRAGEDEGDQEAMKREKKKRKKKLKEEEGGLEEEVKWALRELVRRQEERESRWLQLAEAREAERKAAEEEWRRAMEALMEERVAMERRWKEVHEERRARVEALADRRDALIAAVISRIDDENVD